MDLIKELGPLALGSRLRRLSERLMRDITRVYDAQQVEFEPRWFAVTYLLNKEGAMNVTAIARALGLTHPAINQIADAMVKRGLLVGHKGKSDERQRMLSLTPKARETVKRLTPVWEEIEAANRELLRSAGKDLLTMVTLIEKDLDRTDMYQRVMTRLQDRRLAAIEVVEYKPAFKKHFKSINVEWLRKYFEVEPADEVLLNDPVGKIINKGGMVFFARLDGEVVGTCALIKRGPREYELGKMGVVPKAQGQQVGRCLLTVAINYAKQNGAEAVYLHTSPKLAAATSLYLSEGFVEVPFDQAAHEHHRPSIKMRLEFRSPKRRKR
ncbi:MAG: MarR family transcriptional regulator/GNAT family N-acetyltransferase [bacterium]|nr:MarR family transcriptional regulator/GNAT family N-acetyltransferase [bacterium]